MFCGWRLVNSYRDLERLGSGTLAIDALTEACTFNGQAIRPLSIAGELVAWLRGDLVANNIDAAQLREASLTAALQFASVPREARSTTPIHFARDGSQATTPDFIALDISCHSRIVTNEKVYAFEYEHREEWPPGWPESSAYGRRYVTANNRSSMLSTAAVVALCVAGFRTHQFQSSATNLDISLVIAGGTAALASIPFVIQSQRALAKAVWWYNAALPR